MKYTPSQAQMAVNVFLKAGDTAAAQGVIEQAENNNRPDLYCAIASVQISQHQVDDAVGSYLKALAISPEHKDASKGIACLYAGKAAQCVDNQDFDAANDFAHKAMGYTPYDQELASFAINLELRNVMAGKKAQHPDEVFFSLEKYYQKNTSQMNVAHKLAMLSHQFIIKLEEDGQQSANPYEWWWHQAYAFWGVVLGSDGYWSNYVADRQKVYETEINCDEGTLIHARFETIQAQILDVNQNFIKMYLEKSQANDAARHRTLSADWILEIAATKALAEVLSELKSNGIMVPLTLACGPLFWSSYHLEGQVKTAVNRYAALPGVNDEKVGPIQEYLTPIGRARVFQKMGLNAEAIALVRSHLTQNKSDQRAKALFVDLLMNQGETLISSNFEAGLACWKEARSNAANTETVDNLIVSSVLAKVQSFNEQNQPEKAKEILLKAIKIIPEARPLKDQYYQIENTRLMKEFDRDFSGNNSVSQNLRVITGLTAKYKALDLLIGPGHPKVRDQLEQLSDIENQLRAKELVDDAVDIYNRITPGNPRVTRIQLEDSLSKLESAKRLCPAFPKIDENIRVVRNTLIQVRGY